jgi:chromosome segregation ATPase
MNNVIIIVGLLVVAVLGVIIWQLSQKLTNGTTQLKNATDKNKELAHQLEDIQGELNTIKSSLESERQENQSLQLLVNQLKNQLTDTEQKYDQSSSNLTEFNTVNQSLKTDLQTMQDQYNQTLISLTQVQSENQSLKTDLQTTQDQYNQTLIILTQVQSENQSLKTDLQTTQDQYNQTLAILTTINQQNELLQNTVNQLQTEIVEIQLETTTAQNSVINTENTETSQDDENIADIDHLIKEFPLVENLANLLAAKNWQEADQETLELMFKLTHREQERWFDINSIQNLDSRYLAVIDQLWLNYSAGKFGLSIQQQIWQNIGGDINASNQVYQTFSDRLGWRIDQQNLDINQLNFNLNAPRGHLPALPIRLDSLSSGITGFWWEKKTAYIVLLYTKNW